jgi:alpha-L-fucosidase 2
VIVVTRVESGLDPGRRAGLGWGMTIMTGDVRWETMGAGSRDSLPLGNGDVAANVWTEADGGIGLYLAKGDAWDHLGRLIKIGRLHLRLDPPLESASFFQTLTLADASVRIGDARREVHLWIDAHAPVLEIVITSRGGVTRVEAGLDRWREDPRDLGGPDRHGVTGWFGGSVELRSQPDTVVSDEPAAVAWYQHNTSSVWAFSLQQQGLAELMPTGTDPLLHRTFGGWMAGAGWTRPDERTLETRVADAPARLGVLALTQAAGPPAGWREAARAAARRRAERCPREAWAAHEAHWAAYWSRSHIHLTARGLDYGAAEQINRQSRWWRYLVGGAGRAAYPIKFNGGLYTADWGLPGEAFDGDYRRWGGGYWFQNTRLIYWALLAGGDYDLLEPFAAMYRGALPLAEHRTRVWYGHEGAFFPETMTFWGTYLPDNYGWDRTGRPVGEVQNRYIRHYWTSGLEMIALLHAVWRHTGDDTWRDRDLVPLARGVLRFFARHYPDDAAGRLHIAPAQSLETWWEAENPAPEVAALHDLLPRLLALPDGVVDEATRAEWVALRARLPELPRRMVDGEPVLAPAVVHEDVPKNSENAELYSVFPFRLFGLGRPDLDLARRTFLHRLVPDTGGWRQDAVQAALLGLTSTATFYVHKNLAEGPKPARFEGFMGPNYDWVPDFDHTSVSQLALQTMLLQEVEGKLLLFPAWPAGRWNVDFKLHAPGRTVIAGELRDGQLVRLEVDPPERRADVVNCLEKPVVK